MAKNPRQDLAMSNSRWVLMYELQGLVDLTAHDYGRGTCNESDGALDFQALASCHLQRLKSSRSGQGSLCSGHLLTTHLSQAFRCALETEIPSSPSDSRESAQPR
jgi:hypothetical protein